MGYYHVLTIDEDAIRNISGNGKVDCYNEKLQKEIGKKVLFACAFAQDKLEYEKATEIKPFVEFSINVERQSYFNALQHNGRIHSNVTVMYLAWKNSFFSEKYFKDIHIAEIKNKIEQLDSSDG